MKRSSSRKLTRIKKSSSPHRVSKVTKQQQQQQQHQEQQQQKFYEIALKRPLSSSSSCPPLSPPSSISSPSSSVATPFSHNDAIVSDDDPQVHFLADQLKRQLSNALDKVSSSPSSSEHLGTATGGGDSKGPLRTSSLSTTTPPDLVSDDVGAPAASHWRLHNLDLLKQYLMFVAQEASIDIQHDDNNDGCGERKIVIGIPNENHHIHPGARLIESYVHGQSKMTSVIEGQNKASSCSSSSHTTTTTVPPKQQHRRRRRSSRQKQKPNAVPSSSASATAAAEPTRMIKCICDTPNEGFGAMVQCDDCHRWLHLECLKMTDEFAHQENFACPQCFVSNDNALDRRGRVSSSITWRYAARRESERMAAAMDMEMTSDEEEEGHQDQKSMRCCDNDNDDDNDTDVGTHSEASTPEYYVQSQEGGGASRMDYFAPHASDVFLCESSIHGPTTISPTTITTDALPSSLCTQDLLEFSFDTGPFWKPIL